MEVSAGTASEEGSIHGADLRGSSTLLYRTTLELFPIREVYNFRRTSRIRSTQVTPPLMHCLGAELKRFLGLVVEEPTRPGTE